MGKIMSLEELLAVPDAGEVTEVVPVPAWGGAVRIKAFSLAEQRAMREAARDERGLVDGGRMAVQMLVHGLAEPRVTAEQAEALLRKAVGPLELILQRLLDLSGLNPQGQVSEKAVVEAEKSLRAR